MNKRSIAVVAGIVGVIVLASVVGYVAAPRFTDRNAGGATPLASLAGASDQERLLAQIPSEVELTAMPEFERLVVQDTLMQDFAALPGTPMTEALPAGPPQPAVVLSGKLTGADSAHKGSGTVALYALPDGGHLLRLENLDVTNGPDLHIVLTENPNPADVSALGEHILVSPLKSNLGNQNYSIPAGGDLSEFKSAVIYSKRFGVVFARAALEAGGS